MSKGEFAKNAKRGAAALLLGSVCMTPFMVSQAKADTDQIIQNVIQNILQNVRDQIQSRRLLPPPGPGQALRFSSEDAASNPGDPFSALGYAKEPRLYTKAPPMVAAPQPQWLYGLNVSASGDESRSDGVTTRSVAGVGAVDITKIGITSASDAISVIFTGMGVWSTSSGTDSTTAVGAGTIAYVNGGFSADFTVDGTWTRSRLAAAGVVTTTDSTGLSYAPNVQYKFELPNTWFFEPTVGVTYTETFTANFGARTGNSTEVHGGARIGFETMWDAVRVQPSLSLVAFSIVDQSGIAAPVVLPPGVPGAVGGAATKTGDVGGRASGKLNFIWSNNFSSWVEAHGSVITNTDAFGASGGLRWTF